MDQKMNRYSHTLIIEPNRQTATPQILPKMESWSMVDTKGPGQSSYMHWAVAGLPTQTSPTLSVRAF